jgi:hypothetical protein
MLRRSSGTATIIRRKNGLGQTPTDFANNLLLKKLRDEWRAAHPPKPRKTTKPKPARTKSDTLDLNVGLRLGNWGLCDPDSSEPEMPQKPVKHQAQPVKHQAPKEPANRNRDRHRPGYVRNYLREYMRKRRARMRQG